MKTTYAEIGQIFDELFDTHHPWEGEAERMIFRARWLEALRDCGWTEKEWEEELELRIEIIQMKDSKLVRFK